MTTLKDITSESELKQHLSNVPSSALTVLYFHAPWAAPCAQMHTILTTLAQTYTPTSPTSIQILTINAEDLYEISGEYDVTIVPYLVLQKDGKTVDTLSGCDAAKVRNTIEKHYSPNGANGTDSKNALPPALTATQRPDDGGSKANGEGAADLSSYAPTSSDPATAPAMTSQAKANSTSIESTQKDINERLSELVKAAPVMLFMKGTPSAPQCGFSRTLVGLLRERSVRYGFFNILADEDVRQGLKVFADWPTYPQLWVGGELVGGLDIVKEELENDPKFFDQYAVQKTNGVTAGGA